MGIAEKNNAQLYQHNGLTPNPKVAIVIMLFNIYKYTVTFKDHVLYLSLLQIVITLYLQPSKHDDLGKIYDSFNIAIGVCIQEFMCMKLLASYQACVDLGHNKH